MADQMQPAEKAVDEIRTEQTIKWNGDPFGREGQYQRLFSILDARTNELIAQHESSVNSLQLVSNLSEKLVSEAARAGYAALEQVVHALLRIEHGQTRLSREDATILDALHGTVEKFEAVCATSEHTTADIALESERCMRLGDNAAKFLDVLTGYMNSLNIESRAIWGQKCVEEGACDEARRWHGDYERHVNNAREERDSIGTNFLGFFDSDVKYNADKLVYGAEQNLRNNEARIANKKRLATIFYQLSMTARNASAAIHTLNVRVQNVANEYDVDFRRVTDELQVANALWKGLMELKNVIWATDLYTTRDSSLRVILQLLERDDEVFHREMYFEETQMNIQQAICGKLGGDAVGRIRAGEGEQETLEGGFSDL
ncbi:hypothetical protein BJY04DRAFT_212587 [Aspergillus karnatakaensis]|uniref:uncharacterized protein n=1 Tax=Aspergillus karnatakaensis TaxID=1810916 RepID=UPI003CCDA613